MVSRYKTAFHVLVFVRRSSFFVDPSIFGCPPLERHSHCLPRKSSSWVRGTGTKGGVLGVSSMSVRLENKLTGWRMMAWIKVAILISGTYVRLGLAMPSMSPLSETQRSQLVLVCTTSTNVVGLNAMLPSTYGSIHAVLLAYQTHQYSHLLPRCCCCRVVGPSEYVMSGMTEKTLQYDPQSSTYHTYKYWCISEYQLWCIISQATGILVPLACTIFINTSLYEYIPRNTSTRPKY